MRVNAQAWHQGSQIADLVLGYAGQVNVFEGGFSIGEVAKNYEVLKIRVTASEAAALNFGCQEHTYRLEP